MFCTPFDLHITALGSVSPEALGEHSEMTVHIWQLANVPVEDAEAVRKRRVEVAQRRQRLDNPAEQEFLNLCAGAESLISEMYHKDGEKATLTGKIKVKNGSIAKAIGRNLK